MLEKTSYNYMQNISEIKRPISNINLNQRQQSQRIELPENKPKKNFPKLTLIFWIIIILIIIFGIIKFDVLGVLNPSIKKTTEWQAIFLNDGQVYFGKVIKKDNDVLALEEIYYLQNPGALQQGENNLNEKKGEINLIKLGNEIHGPTDQMQINWKNVLFVENLKQDSKIVNAIENYKK